MNTTQAEFVATGGATTQTDALINKLHEANGAWVSLTELVKSGCGYAVHSRAADARRMGINVENRVEFNPATRKRHSFYRLLAP